MVDGGCCFSSPGFQIANIASSLEPCQHQRAALDFLSSSSKACPSVTSSSATAHQSTNSYTAGLQPFSLGFAASLQDHLARQNFRWGI